MTIQSSKSIATQSPMFHNKKIKSLLYLLNTLSDDTSDKTSAFGAGGMGYKSLAD